MSFVSKRGKKNCFQCYKCFGKHLVLHYGDVINVPPSATLLLFNVSKIKYMFTEMGEHLVKHGDGVKDIAFTVENCDSLVQVTMSNTIFFHMNQNVQVYPYVLTMNTLGYIL